MSKPHNRANEQMVFYDISKGLDNSKGLRTEKIHPAVSDIRGTAYPQNDDKNTQSTPLVQKYSSLGPCQAHVGQMGKRSWRPKTTIPQNIKREQSYSGFRHPMFRKVWTSRSPARQYPSSPKGKTSLSWCSLFWQLVCLDMKCAHYKYVKCPWWLAVPAERRDCPESFTRWNHEDALKNYCWMHDFINSSAPADAAVITH